MLSGLYRIPAIYAEVTLAFTNTVPVDAYRGAGRPEAAYFVERTVDQAARELGVGPHLLRRRNFIPPEAMPYTTPTGLTYDSGEFQRVMDAALDAAGWGNIALRKSQALKQGKLRGLGFACYVEACAGQMGSEDARLRIAEDGSVALYVGTQSNGQGHATAYAQILADALGIDPTKVTLHQGDTDDLPSGGGTSGSRSLLMGGGATGRAADKLVDKARTLAGFVLEAAPADLEFEAGTFTVAGTDKRITLTELAGHAARDDLPEELQGGLEESATFDPPDVTFPNGCHVCELEVDEETGVVDVLRYTVVDDFGVIVNPSLARGQVMGGTAQGIGQALLENTHYDAESGQLVTATFQDYTMPRADDVPGIDIQFLEVPCATNPFGIKGAGEAGAIGAPPAVMNALADALAPLGVGHIDMPATPDKIWRAIQAAKA
jgi:carbon-monoxide dehydrogenase large subunit